MVTMRTRVGGSRVVDMLSGEHLARICWARGGLSTLEVRDFGQKQGECCGFSSRPLWFDDHCLVR